MTTAIVSVARGALDEQGKALLALRVAEALDGAGRARRPARTPARVMVEEVGARPGAHAPRWVPSG